MEAFIKAHPEGAPTDLNLENWKSPEIAVADQELLESFTSLSSISFKSSGLTSLSNFPRNLSLIDIDLNDNHLSGGLEALAALPNLMMLSLENNNIISVEA